MLPNADGRWRPPARLAGPARNQEILAQKGRQVVGSRERKKAAARQAMIDAAARLFVAQGVDGTTMDDIARAAGTSRTSVFNYFGYKEMILCEIGARYVAEIAGTTNLSSRRSPRRLLLDSVDVLAVLTERNPTLLSAIARELSHPDPERRRCAAETMGYAAMVETTLASLQRSGRLRSARWRDADARMLIDMVASTVVRAGGDFPMRDLRAELHHTVDVFLEGVLKPA
jgi:AcrR family transcriptional regulator